MKSITKLAVAAIVAVMASLGANAQLIVHNNGNTHLGDTATVDTTATLHIAGTGSNGSRGKVAFGNLYTNMTSVFVGEYAEPLGNPDTDRLWLHGRNGLSYTVNNDKYVAMTHSPYSLIGFNFRCPISSRAAYIATDPRLNDESAAVTTALDMLQELEAISYRMNLPIQVDEGSMQPNVNLGDPDSPNGTGMEAGSLPGNYNNSDSLHYGLTLESVQDVLPQLVIEDESGIKYVDYNSIIPLLVVAVNELRSQVDYLTDQLDIQQGGNAPMSQAPARAAQTSGTSDLAGGPAVAALHQNIPNPFTDDTHIRYNLPESVAQADLYIYDMQGHQIRHIAVEDRGESSVTIHGSELQAGMYIYALIADGQEVDSKRMILTK